MGRKPPAGLVEQPEDLFRRTSRKAALFVGFFRKQHTIQFLICLVILTVNILIFSAPFLERFEYVVLDLFFRQRPPIAAHPAIGECQGFVPF